MSYTWPKLERFRQIEQVDFGHRFICDVVKEGIFFVGCFDRRIQYAGILSKDLQVQSSGKNHYFPIDCR